MMILLTQDQQSTIKATCEHVLTETGENWYHMPYWIRDCGGGRFEQVRYESLPQQLKDFILQQKGIK